MSLKFKERNLYLVTGEEYSAGRSTERVVSEAIKGGVDIVQMREKGRSLTELAELGRDLAVLCRENDVTFIVNDDPFLAVEVGADGVHLGQEDMERFPLEKVRDIVGKDRIIGVSTHTKKQFIEADTGKYADYVAFGPVFRTETKDYHIGYEDVFGLIRGAEKPVVIIGGINIDNVDILLGLGVRNVAVIRAVTRAVDIAGNVAALKVKINRNSI